MNDSQCPLVLKPDYTIVVANSFVKGKLTMTQRERQLLYVAISQILYDDKDFKTCIAPAKEVAEFLGIDPKKYIEDLPDICKKLNTRAISIQMSDGSYKGFPIMQEITYRNGILTLRLNDNMKPYMIALKKCYSELILGTMCSFKSVYTSQIYMLIVCESKANPYKPKNEWYFSCEDIRSMFDIKKSKYKKSSDLIKNTVQVAYNELKQSPFVRISNYQEHKSTTRGRPLEGVSFKAIVMDKEKQKEWFNNRFLSILSNDSEDTTEEK